ncbi:MAG: hypothetical protein M1813_009753 [Trichoglossum hirsutum]|nr:MAG: hypothetical protein M1813_009753 [Trichoglossum hirsutum]
MTMESDPAVTRVTVILDTPNDWPSWLFIRKDSCRRYELWQYVDPDTPREQLLKLTALHEPQYTDYKVNAARLADLSTDDLTLKKHLAPDVATRCHELTAQYNALKTASRAVKKIEQWLADWTRVTSMGKSISLSKTEGVRPQEDFLVACKDLDSEYAVTCLRDVYKAENAGTTN